MAARQQKQLQIILPVGITAIFYCRAWQASVRGQQASACGHIGSRPIARRMIGLKFWTSGRYAPSGQASASITGSRQASTCGHIGFRPIARRMLWLKFWTSGRYAPGRQASASITGSRQASTCGHIGFRLIAGRVLWSGHDGKTVINISCLLSAVSKPRK